MNKNSEEGKESADKKKPILSWDENEIIKAEVKYQLEEQKAEPEEPQRTEDEIRKQIWEGDTLSFARDDFQEGLTELINEMSPDGYWSASVKGFGWRGLDGEKEFSADNAGDFIGAILPKTDCTFYIYKTDEGLSINNFHHDSPVGKEWYYLEPMTYEEYHAEEE